MFAEKVDDKKYGICWIFLFYFLNAKLNKCIYDVIDDSAVGLEMSGKGRRKDLLGKDERRAAELEHSSCRALGALIDSPFYWTYVSVNCSSIKNLRA